jgi:hypothetical protein
MQQFESAADVAGAGDGGTGAPGEASFVTGAGVAATPGGAPGLLPEA